MAIFRKIHTSFWSDCFISELDKDKKLFYIYLLTNEHTTQCGIYEITKKQIAFDLGYSIDTVSRLLEYFINTGKIRYNNKTFEVAMKNWHKYNPDTSPKVKSCVAKELKNVKDTSLIQYIYSIDTQSQQEQEQEQECSIIDIPKTWRSDFETYKQGLRESYIQLKNDDAWMNEKKTFHPNVDIIKTLDKVCLEYWATERGWKKKKASKSVDIDWKSTLTNSLNYKENKVYEQNRK